MSKILVCSTAEQSYQFVMPDSRIVIIVGKNKQFAVKSHIMLPYGETIIDKADWEYILNAYKHAHVIRDGLIFVEKNRSETEARARDDDQQGLDIGTKPLTKKDLTRPEELTVNYNPVE